MAVDPNLLVIKAVSELPSKATPDAADEFLLYDGTDLKKSTWSNVSDYLASGVNGEAKTTDTPPATGFYRYVAHTAGTYTNFLESGVPIEVTTADLDGNMVFIEVTDNVAKKVVIELPKNPLATVLNPTNVSDAVTGKAVADWSNLNKTDKGGTNSTAKQIEDKASEALNYAINSFSIVTETDGKATNAFNLAQVADGKANVNASDISDIQSEIDTLVLNSGGDSNLEVVQARGGETTLNARLDKSQEQLDSTYDSFRIKSTIIASAKTGRHIAFGGIVRVAERTSVNVPNINMALWRNGINHQNGGFIEGVLVSDYGEVLSERFVVADQVKYPNIGPSGSASPNDFRDVSAVRLPNGQILITFFAIDWNGSTRLSYSSYAQLATYNNTTGVLSFDVPVLQMDDGADPAVGKPLVFGKPIIDGSWIYVASYAVNLAGTLSEVKVLRAHIAIPTVFEIYTNAIVSSTSLAISEPVLVKSNEGKYVIYYRAEGSGSNGVRRVEATTINGTWSAPVTVYEGSTALRGLQVTEEGWLVAGIRFKTELPYGVALLRSKETVNVASPLITASMLYSANIESSEAGYVDIEKISKNRYIGMYHTETGKFIKFFTFNTSQIKDKEVKVGNHGVNAETKVISRTDFIGELPISTYNILQNPLFKLPYGFNGVPFWQGISLAQSEITDPVGVGFSKASTNGGVLRQYINSTSISRLMVGKPVKCAIRMYCEEAGRVRVRVGFGGYLSGTYHGGNGWEIIYVILESPSGASSVHNGGVSDKITLEVTSVTSTNPVVYYLDYASLSFGQTVPEPVNSSAIRLQNMIRVQCFTQSSSFTFADLGIANKITSSYYISMIESNNLVTGVTYTKSASGFTVNLAEGSNWGSSQYLTLEIIG